jgi:hypothetical protein
MSNILNIALRCQEMCFNIAGLNIFKSVLYTQTYVHRQFV